MFGGCAASYNAGLQQSSSQSDLLAGETALQGAPRALAQPSPSRQLLTSGTKYSTRRGDGMPTTCKRQCERHQAHCCNATAAQQTTTHMEAARSAELPTTALLLLLP